VSSWDNWATEPSGEYVSQSIAEPVREQHNYYDSYFVQDAYVVGTGAQGEGEGEWINGDDYTAARLLYAIHEERH